MSLHELDIEDDDDVLVKSLIVSQQCSITQLSAVENEAEDSHPAYNRLGERPQVQASSDTSRVSRLLNGLTVQTETTSFRGKRASLWLSDMVRGTDDPILPHPGTQRKRFSSVEVEGRPQQLLRRWIDLLQADGIHSRAVQAVGGTNDPHVWDEDDFVFRRSDTAVSGVSPKTHAGGRSRISRKGTDPVSPHTSRAAGFPPQHSSHLTRQDTIVEDEPQTTSPISTSNLQSADPVVQGMLETTSGVESHSLEASIVATLKHYNASIDPANCAMFVTCKYRNCGGNSLWSFLGHVSGLCWSFRGC